MWFLFEYKIAGELFDLIGDGGFELIQELLKVFPSLCGCKLTRIIKTDLTNWI